MIKTIAAAAVAVAAFGFTAAPAQAVVPTDVYGYKVWLSENGIYPTRSDVKLGKAVCAAKDNGASWNRIVRVFRNNGFNNRTTAIYVVGAVYELCPRWTGSLDRWINS